MAKYFCKHLRNPAKKAELTPAGFTGRVFQGSDKFLTAPRKELWRQIQAERRASARVTGEHATSESPSVPP